MTATFGPIITQQAVGSLKWVGGRFDPFGEASAALETVSVLDSFTPSLMPRTSQHQGLASGLHLLGARFAGGRLDALQTLVIGAGASTLTSLVARTATAAVGHGLSMLPELEHETLWRSGARSAGAVVRARGDQRCAL